VKMSTGVPKVPSPLLGMMVMLSLAVLAGDDVGVPGAGDAGQRERRGRLIELDGYGSCESSRALLVGVGSCRRRSQSHRSQLPPEPESPEPEGGRRS